MQAATHQAQQVPRDPAQTLLLARAAAKAAPRRFTGESITGFGELFSLPPAVAPAKVVFRDYPLTTR